MKYQILVQISDFLQQFKKINSIKRVDFNIVEISFYPSFNLLFDMSKTHSSIYTCENITKKEHKAPFDIILQKRFSSSNIDKIEILEQNRIIKISANKKNSYKLIKTNIYFEFTGRFTNIIITDEDNIILEALQHYNNATRTIKTSKPLTELPKFNIREKKVDKIVDFYDFFKSSYIEKNNFLVNEFKKNKLINIDKKIKNYQEKLDNLPEQKQLLEESDKLSNLAQILMSNLHNLKDYSRDFILQDFNLKKHHFKIDTPPKMAVNIFFQNSKKLKQKALNILLEKQNLEAKLMFLTSLKDMILQAKNIYEIDTLLPKKRLTLKDEKSSYIKEFFIDNFKILLGINEKGNINLLKNSKKDDFWFHIKDMPGAHVIVKTNKLILSENIIDFASKICVNFSVSIAGVYEVDYTKRQNVKIVSGANVNYTNYKTIRVLKEE